ncbi:glycosyltransferase [Bacteriovorax sp. Seq25_V]|uniref:UDP-N-acetylglucosamine--N-acetylmuramyl- (pentapeptide) pyrophosphoryl-undecaprenol N-acetylglucosamine transferase n=1 Tax=Bacteriovorax sp. Seq25_V TaxID=1201288 RepID=UPI000389E7E5|nr:UDP-N-acetylglucosamine--N-acetylmuramyl-(pentapeptide) pyrophosphoryl-undecaprenol N-acetylglucosamine transferase [Bacteriovorax sp. Seq25_V]EQC47223.1 putative undecaprenyldiphospho-muramoylpentapeptide beta-N-acetylglucosaminyltransferase [Bacteriovorax sp. Seq25_V]
MRKVIVFTGGGSGGHVVPGLTLIAKLRNEGFEVHYIGSEHGIESKLTQGHVDKYYAIQTGKLRRYIDFQNVKDIFKVFVGLLQSIKIILSLRARNLVVVSMGGFVSVPVVIAAKFLFKKAVIHEQTTRVGLANKICSYFADKVFVSFEDSLQFFPSKKTVLSGYPVKEEYETVDLTIDMYEGIKLSEIKKDILFITGGGNGSKLLNDQVYKSLEVLKQKYFIIHQVGQAFMPEYVNLRDDNYIPCAFIGEEMPDIFKVAKVVISRSGAGTVAELMALGKKSIFVPLKIAQKNEQYHNAMAANKKLGSIVIKEDDFREVNFVDLLEGFVSSSEVVVQTNGARDFLVREIQKLYLS